VFVFSAFDMLTGDYLSTETLARLYPETFGHLLSNPNVSRRAKIEGRWQISKLQIHQPTVWTLSE